MFRQDVENADDVRLSVRMFQACLPEKHEFCADIEPRNARVKECLEENKGKTGFREECRCAHILAILAARSHLIDCRDLLAVSVGQVHSARVPDCR
jgi:hypothetical protein